MKKIIYVHPKLVSFVKNDIELLKKYYLIRIFSFSPARKIFTPLHFISQFFFLIFNIFGSSIIICQFGGYHSFLPVIFSKIFRIPVLVVLGGTDCASFPSIGFGNFNRILQGWFTYKSLKYATHLCPVHESLVMCNYTYTDDDFPKQGYKYFYPGIITPHTTIYYGYDSKLFFRNIEKSPDSFITVAKLNKPNFYRKGIDMIFEMAKRFPDCKFTIVGNTKTMRYDYVPENVTLSSFIPYEELKTVYSKHEFYFQLSIHEGFPSAPCEAMLCECIPIVSDVAALHEIAGDCGFILKKKDPDLLEEIIRTALNSDKKYLGEKARRRIIEKFPPGEREKFIELISTLII